MLCVHDTKLTSKMYKNIRTFELKKVNKNSYNFGLISIIR